MHVDLPYHMARNRVLTIPVYNVERIFMCASCVVFIRQEVIGTVVNTLKNMSQTRKREIIASGSPWISDIFQRLPKRPN